MADHKDESKKEERQGARGSGVDQQAPMSGYRTVKRDSDEDYLPEAAGLPGVDMPNMPKESKEQPQQKNKAGKEHGKK